MPRGKIAWTVAGDDRLYVSLDDLLRILDNWNIDERLVDQFRLVEAELDAIGKLPAGSGL